jgi:hypothetical protein
MLVGSIAMVTSNVIPAALADKGGDPNNKGPSQENANERDSEKSQESDDNPNNNGKNRAHDNMHDGKGVEGSSHVTCDPPPAACVEPK